MADMDDVARGSFVLDTTSVMDTYHIATHHMLEHGWVDGMDTPHGPGVQKTNGPRDDVEHDNPLHTE